MSLTASFRSWPGLLLAVSIAIPSGLAAQGESPLRLRLDDTTGGIEIELGDVLAAGRIQGSLESGLPIRIQVVTELWRDRFFDSQEGREEWNATVLYEPLTGTYRIETDERPIGLADSLEAAAELLRGAVSSSLRPQEPGSYYYLGRLLIETLSLSDLEELRRWLRGELAPAVGGDEAVGSALGRGVRRLFVRALALPVIRSQTRTDEFEWEG